jgi:hypothetical protein
MIKKLNISFKKALIKNNIEINTFDKIDNKLIGKYLRIQHSKYMPIQDVVKDIK